MTIVINNVSRSGDIGEPGYSVYGEELPSNNKRHRHDSWHGATIEGCLCYTMPNAYITQSVYNFLTTDELESIRSKVLGVVEDNYTKDFIEDLGPYYGTFTQYALDESKIISTGLPKAGGNDTDDNVHDDVDHGDSDDNVDNGDQSGSDGEEEPVPPEKDIIDQLSDMLGLSRKQIMYAAIIAFIIILIGGMSS